MRYQQHINDEKDRKNTVIGGEGGKERKEKEKKKRKTKN